MYRTLDIIFEHNNEACFIDNLSINKRLLENKYNAAKRWNEMHRIFAVHLYLSHTFQSVETVIYKPCCIIPHNFIINN